MRLRRSELSVPGDDLDAIRAAIQSRSDIVFLDLEDSVRPANKDDAREYTIHALRGLDWRPRTLAVRINGLDSRHCYRDIIELLSRSGDRLDMLLVPKVRSAEDVTFVDRLMTQVCAREGVTRSIGLEVIIEDVDAMLNIKAIAHASKRVEALALGFGDFSVSQGLRRDEAARYPGDIWHFHRNQLVLAARSAGIAAIDGPYMQVGDLDGFRREADRARLLGADGKWSVSESQSLAANEVFTPTDEEATLASDGVAAYKKARETGLEAAFVRGRLIDEQTLPHYTYSLAVANAIADETSQAKGTNAGHGMNGECEVTS